MSSVPSEDRAYLLVVDDEPAIREMLAEFLDWEGYIVETAADGQEALDRLASKPFDLVLTDLKMPKMGGLVLLERMKAVAPAAMAVIMTGFGTVDTAIEAMKHGAYDYILKPFKLDEVLRVVERALEKRRFQSENLRLRQALSLYKVSEAITTSLSLDQVVNNVTDSCIEQIGADVVSVWLDDDEGGIKERERVEGTRDGFESSQIGRFHLDAITRHLTEQGRLLAHDAETRRFFEDGEAEAVQSLAAAPLRSANRMIGLVIIASTHPVKRFQEGGRKMLAMIASRAAAAIDNARLYQSLQDTFQQTIEGLASAVDKMDRYTAGHSQRVAIYAERLARRLGLDERQIEIVKQSALMHDIGKIGCVMNLNKPDQLTDDEYEQFKLHPGHGRDILSPISFLHPLIPGVHLHHERFDGRGYPLGLAKKDIPLMARIISVADAYDAMTCDRAYRRALPHDVATMEIERCSGGQFDPEVAGEFLEEIEEARDEARERGEEVPD